MLGGKPAEWDQIKDRMVANLRAWAKAAEEAKIVIAIKAHVMNAVQTPERLLWLWQTVNHPAIQLAYDYSHFQVQGLAFDETFAAILPHTSFIHVKDVSGTPEKVKFLLPVKAPSTTARTSRSSRHSATVATSSSRSAPCSSNSRRTTPRKPPANPSPA